MTKNQAATRILATLTALRATTLEHMDLMGALNSDTQGEGPGDVPTEAECDQLAAGTAGEELATKYAATVELISMN